MVRAAAAGKKRKVLPGPDGMRLLDLGATPGAIYTASPRTSLGADGDRLCGVSIIGRPVARRIDDGWTAEVRRCCTDGTPNACSTLLRASWRIMKALGDRKVITFTLPEEGGASLRAAGFRLVIWRVGARNNSVHRLGGALAIDGSGNC